MDKKQIILEHLDQLANVAKALLLAKGEHNIWFIEGEMGAGKTTLITEICKQLGVIDNIGSPTYSLVNEYQSINNQTIYHFDFYRLKTEMEALDYGLEEYFDSGNLCICEWPSQIPNLWPSQYFYCKITILEDGKRNIEFYEKI